MRTLQWINHLLMIAFGISSGAFKILGGEPDVKMYGVLGFSAAATVAVGVVQLLAGAALIPAKTRVPGAITLALINTLATVVLFVNGVQPFGAISILFIAMALAELKFSSARR